MLLATCCEPGCEILVLIGGTCVEHDVRSSPVAVRGRPFAAALGRAETRALSHVRGVAGRAPSFDRRSFPSVAGTTRIGR